MEEIIRKLQKQADKYRISDTMRSMAYEGLDNDGRWSADVSYQDGYAAGIDYAIKVLTAENSES